MTTDKVFKVIDPSGETCDFEAPTMEKAQAYCDNTFYEKMCNIGESTHGEHEEEGWVIVEAMPTDDDPIELARHDYTASFEDEGSDYDQHNTMWRGCAI